ncbi:MAG: hypothetical protein M1839_002692 [Geoglossum umbratile]|nr:MAG: hypothetical protein M1839_002692 [Geoglossum umbratile]
MTTQSSKLKSEDRLIAVMGATGSGKSSFVQSITGRKDIVGDSLCSETSEIHSYCVVVESVSFVLIDTPGFDDTFGSDTDILKKIEDWLSSSYEPDRLLSGLLYLHPINMVRVSGSSHRSLKMFQMLCGEKNFPNIVIGTTFWDKLPNAKTGIEREKELCESPDFWKPMREKGCRVVRVPSDYSTSAGILLEMARNAPCTLQIQEETLLQGKPLEETSAGIAADEDTRAGLAAAI